MGWHYCLDSGVMSTDMDSYESATEHFEHFERITRNIVF